jgi:hypothetical protein
MPRRCAAKTNTVERRRIAETGATTPVCRPRGRGGACRVNPKTSRRLGRGHHDNDLGPKYTSRRPAGRREEARSRTQQRGAQSQKGCLQGGVRRQRRHRPQAFARMCTYNQATGPADLPRPAGTTARGGHGPPEKGSGRTAGSPHPGRKGSGKKRAAAQRPVVGARRRPRTGGRDQRPDTHGGDTEGGRSTPQPWAGLTREDPSHHGGRGGVTAAGSSSPSGRGSSRRRASAAGTRARGAKPVGPQGACIGRRSGRRRLARGPRRGARPGEQPRARGRSRRPSPSCARATCDGPGGPRHPEKRGFVGVGSLDFLGGDGLPLPPFAAGRLPPTAAGVEGSVEGGVWRRRRCRLGVAWGRPGRL